MRYVRGLASRITLIAALAAGAAPAFAQRLGQGTETDISMWRVVGALLLCLALAFVAALVLKRRLGGGVPLSFVRGRRLQLIERVRLTSQAELCLVSRDGTEFLIAAGPHGATLIEAGPVPPPDARA